MSRAQRDLALFVVVLCAAAVAWALPFRQPNCNTASHFALVQALASGDRTIDAFQGESCDISWWRGHTYANKAPGLALATVPWYFAVRSAGLLRPDRESDASYPRAMRGLPRRDLWLMGLWGAVLPSLLLLVLVRHQTNRLVPGLGTAAAALLAFATLLLPFAGLFFSHALGAFLDFAAFVVVGRRPTALRAAFAGCLAGLAVVVEYPNTLLVLVLLGLVLARPVRRARAVAAYLAGLAVGVAPLAAYDRWSFGSAFHLSYVGAVLHPGVSGHDVLGANSGGFFGVGVPSLGRLAHLLAGDRSLLMTAPVLVLAPLGVLRLWRAGLRWHAAAIVAVALVFLTYNAGYYSPIGGATPGPRFLIATLPFLVVAVAAAIPTAPRRAAVLLVAGVVVLLAGDVTQPLIGNGYTPLSWWRWIRAGSFTSTVLDPTAHGWAPAAAIAVAVVTGLAAGSASLVPGRQRGGS